MQNGGTWNGTQILNRTTVDYMKERSGFGESGEDCSNVLWLYEKRLLQGYAEVLGHDGSDEGISTYAYFNPQTGVGYILLTNGDIDQKKGQLHLDDAAINIGSRIMATFDHAEDAEAAQGHVFSRRRRRPKKPLPKAEALGAAGGAGGQCPSFWPGCASHAPGCKDL